MIEKFKNLKPISKLFATLGIVVAFTVLGSALLTAIGAPAAAGVAGADAWAMVGASFVTNIISPAAMTGWMTAGLFAYMATSVEITSALSPENKPKIIAEGIVS